MISAGTKGATNYKMVHILDTEVPTLCAPGENHPAVDDMPDSLIVYLSKKTINKEHFALPPNVQWKRGDKLSEEAIDGIAQINIVKPISTQNENSLLHEDVIKENHRLVTIQQFANGLLVSFHEKFAPINKFIIVLKINKQEAVVLGNVNDSAGEFGEVGYKWVESVYQNYCDETFVKLSAQKAAKEPAQPVDAGPSKTAGKKDTCILC